MINGIDAGAGIVAPRKRVCIRLGIRAVVGGAPGLNDHWRAEDVVHLGRQPSIDVSRREFAARGLRERRDQIVSDVQVDRRIVVVSAFGAECEVAAHTRAGSARHHLDVLQATARNRIARRRARRRARCPQQAVAKSRVQQTPVAGVDRIAGVALLGSDRRRINLGDGWRRERRGAAQTNAGNAGERPHVHTVVAIRKTVNAGRDHPERRSRGAALGWNDRKLGAVLPWRIEIRIYRSGAG